LQEIHLSLHNVLRGVTLGVMATMILCLQ